MALKAHNIRRIWMSFENSYLPLRIGCKKAGGAEKVLRSSFLFNISESWTFSYQFIVSVLVSGFWLRIARFSFLHNELTATEAEE